MLKVEPLVISKKNVKPIKANFLSQSMRNLHLGIILYPKSMGLYLLSFFATTEMFCISGLPCPPPSPYNSTFVFLKLKYTIFLDKCNGIILIKLKITKVLKGSI